MIRAIVASRIPVVSAVGHEIDVTLADLAADLRALTPSEAAEHVVPAMEAVSATLHERRKRLTAALRKRLGEARGRAERSPPGACSKSRLTGFTSSGDNWISGNRAPSGPCGSIAPLLGGGPRRCRPGWNRSVPWECWPAVIV